MSVSLTFLLVILGAIATFSSGLFGIYHRAPTNLSSEISIYIGASLFTLLPFLFLALLIKKESPANFLVAIGGITMGGLGVWIYLEELVFSKEPSWGFSIIIAPVLQLICFLVIWSLVALTRRSRGTP